MLSPCRMNPLGAREAGGSDPTVAIVIIEAEGDKAKGLERRGRERWEDFEKRTKVLKFN